MSQYRPGLISRQVLLVDTNGNAIGVTGAPLVTSGGGGGGDVVVTNIQDGAGDSVMDAANNAMRVNIVAGAGSGGTAMTDEAAFTEGATSFTPIGGVFNDALASDPAPGQAAAARITSDRAVHTNLRNASGAEVGTAAAPVRTDPTGTTAQPVTDNGGSLTVDGTVAVSNLTTPTSGTVSSGSGTITTGGISQPVFAAPGTTRLWVEIINVSDETLWVNWNGVAAVQNQPSVPLLGNGLGILRFTARDDGFVPQTAINIIGATTGKAFTAYQVLA